MQEKIRFVASVNTSHLFVQNVAKRQKFHLNQEKTDLFFAANALQRSRKKKHLQHLLHLLVEAIAAETKPLGYILVHGGFGYAEFLCRRAHGCIIFDNIFPQNNGSAIYCVPHTINSI